GERRNARTGLVAGREKGITPVKYSATAEQDPHGLDARAQPDGGFKGPASKRIITGYGFWIFLLSDFILFSGFYAAYAVLSHATAGGPSPHKLFDLRIVAFETTFL